jgi:BMFP domain-containing protein YqiC
MKDKPSIFDNALESILPKLKLVSREEFDIQCKVLHKTIAKLAELEERLINLENQAPR